jgi:DNA-binding response OmpR family regulator
MMASILVVEDDIDIAKGIGEFVETLGHELDFAYTGNQAIKMISDEYYDLILLDINLPNVSGYEICQSLLGEHLATTPVIMMSANQDEQDVLKGFQSGAWDYLKKPFSYTELNARINVALSKVTVTTLPQITVGDLSLDTKSKVLSNKQNVYVQLHNMGFLIIKNLMENAPKAVTTSQLINRLWPDELPQSNPLRANVYALKKQLKEVFKKDLVHSVKGVGYKFDAER